MIEIRSKDNPHYKLCVQLKQKKYRDRHGLYRIEGEHLLEEARRRDIPLRMIFVRSGRAFSEEPGWPRPYGVREELFLKIADTETSQGLVAVAEKRSWTAEAFFAASAGKNILLLDRLQDPGNVGAMIRTAEAAGYGGVVVMKGTGDVYSDKAVRAAAGSLFSLPVLPVDTPEEALGLLRRFEKKTVSACPEASRTYFEEDLSSGIALLIGNEGGGLCAALADGADVKVNIPMARGVDSLNAAVAAGILMYEKERNQHR